MDNKGRENFWKVIKDARDNSSAEIKKLMDASPWPKSLCRFRPVNENSLQQLQDNKLFYSSADYYDDPFDTYFYINVEQMVPVYNEMRKDLLEGNEEFIKKLQQIALSINQNPNKFISILSNTSIDFSLLKGQLQSIRHSIQRKLFSICFCEDPYNETLWLKYAENYSGFVQIYDLESTDTFMCGKADECLNCISAKESPYIYPVYYSNIRYDATRYALSVWLMEKIERLGNKALLTPFYNYIQASLAWEVERISLIKKKCHENDQEWRMIRPAISEQRSYIKMKPSKVIIGLRTPEYERKLIVSAAKIAGIQEIHKIYINNLDKLDSEPIKE